MKTVEHSVDIDVEVLQEKALGSTYWENCLDFYERVKDKIFNQLSEKERKWLGKIESDLEEQSE